jgi:hypothetical protein
VPLCTHAWRVYPADEVGELPTAVTEMDARVARDTKPERGKPTGSVNANSGHLPQGQALIAKGNGRRATTRRHQHHHLSAAAASTTRAPTRHRLNTRTSVSGRCDRAGSRSGCRGTLRARRCRDPGWGVEKRSIFNRRNTTASQPLPGHQLRRSKRCSLLTRGQITNGQRRPPDLRIITCDIDKVQLTSVARLAIIDSAFRVGGGDHPKLRARGAGDVETLGGRG